MFDASAIQDELEDLKRELRGLLAGTEQKISEGAENLRSRADPAVEQIKAALNDLGDAFAREETTAEELVAEHPVAALASALALGIVIGLLLRR
jgi:ElaB/YqjD/DUF883 family membrane-anchored ribosome-binding protein